MRSSCSLHVLQACSTHHALEVENYVCLGQKPTLITNTEHLHFAVTHRDLIILGKNLRPVLGLLQLEYPILA